VHAQLEKVLVGLDYNNKIFRDTLLVLDMSVQAIASAVDDFICGRPVPKIFNDGEHVDFNKYLKDFQDKLRRDPADTAESTSTVIETPTDEEVHIFGGSGGG